MNTQLDTLEKDFTLALQSIKTETELKELEQEYLGKTGKLKAILGGIKDLSVEEKKTIGVRANELRDSFTQALEQKAHALEELAFTELESQEAIDVTIGYPSSQLGHKHPISHATELLEDIFISLGFTIEDGPQIEDETHNFDMLNIPDNHPARDVWDTFWISDEINAEKAP